ncbi:MAG: TerC/Alx family metal homeostasis membrane protein [Ignavibacteriales bacterium]|nr:TerC/Alx family metal homeostasis membrane protein [Ignavibacteriales bacterium]
MPVRKAIVWTLFWIALSLLVNAGIYFVFGQQKAMEFLAGYLIEKSLSVDNLFVFLMLFTYFGIQPRAQRRALNYGIAGVLVLRGILIFAGSALISQFHWVLYVFGAILIYSGFKIVTGHEVEVHPDRNLASRIFRKLVPYNEKHQGEEFFTKDDGRWKAAPLLLVLIVIETTDVVFAIDSIPAIFGITTDPLIVFSSNLLAVLGLRSLYFVLEHVQKAFIYVKYGVGVVLTFVGLKMLLDRVYAIDTFTSLMVVVGILGFSVVLSIIKNARTNRGSRS